MIRGIGSPVEALVVPADASWVATTGVDQPVRLWDSTDAGARYVLVQPGGLALLAAPEGGEWLASATRPGTVNVWDPSAGTGPRELLGHIGPVRALVAAPDGTWLASAGEDGTVRIWDPTGSAPPRKIFTEHTAPAQALAVAPDGSWLASAGRDGVLAMYATDGWQLDAAVRVGAILTGVSAAGSAGIAVASQAGLFVWGIERD